MNRKTLFGRVTRSLTAERPEYASVRLEPLEDRKMLVATVYVNDDWTDVDNPGGPVQIGDYVQSSIGTDGVSVIAEYGFDAFGTVEGSTQPGAATIYDAIQATSTGGTLNLLGGTYAESDIVIDRPMSFLGQGTSGATASVIVPEVVSAAVQENFGVGTHSGIIIYSPTVNIANVRVDGAGNGSLAGSYNFHQGITTLYDTQNGGDYNSLHNGLLPLIQLGADGSGEGGAGSSIADLSIDNVSVSNAYWHGVTISALQDLAFDPGSEENYNLQITNSQISDIGDVKDVNRVGVLLQNLTDENNSMGNARYVTVTNAGVGFKSNAYGSSPVFGQNHGATNQSYLRYVTAVDPVVRGIDVEFANRTDAYGWTVTQSNPANTAVGVYLNYARSQLVGATITGAKIGVQVQNAPVASTGTDVFSGLGWETSITGPAGAPAGSVGWLITSGAGDQYGVNTTISPDVSISGFETGVKLEQPNAPASGLQNVVIWAGNTYSNGGKTARLSGNTTDISVGNNTMLSGAPNVAGNVVTSGNGTIDPRMYNWNPQDPYYYDGPGNSGNGSAAPDNADVQNTGNVTFGSSSTFSTLLTNKTTSADLFNFNSAATYNFTAPPDNPVDGVVPQPYGALFGWYPHITQSGDGVMSVSNGINGYQYEYMFGTNNTPITSGPNAGKYQLVGTDISNMSHINMKVMLRPENVSHMFAFGLVDFRGNVNAWTVDATQLSSTTWTTLTFNLLTPTIDLTGPDSHLDLTNVAGWLFGGDQGLANDMHTVPVGFTVDDISTSSVPNSELNVTGTVTLGGAALNVNPQFSPTVGQSWTIINNDGADAVSGTFSSVTPGYSVSYTAGDGNDVVLTYTGTSVTPMTVVGQQIFYNNSSYDANTPAISASDDAAIATDKAAFNGVGTAPTTAFTSYSKGINGIMIDVTNEPGNLSLSDFTFKVGTNNMPNLWANAPAPTGFSIRPGAGAGGSDRVEIIWADSAVANEWLQVVVRGNDTVGGNWTNTGLTTSDVFFYGNRIGDNFTGEPPTLVTTNAGDEIYARNNTGFLLPVTNITDFNKDKFVNAADQIVARNNGGFLTRVINWVPPAAPVASPSVATSSSDGTGSAVASALAIHATPSLPNVPGWIASRLASVDLNSGPIATVFTHLAAADTPRTRQLLQAVDQLADDLGLDDSLLDSLIGDVDETA